MAQGNPPGGQGFGAAQGLGKVLAAFADKKRQQQWQEDQEQEIIQSPMPQVLILKPTEQIIADKKIQWFWYPSFTKEITVTATYYKTNQEDGINAGEYFVTLNVSQAIQKKNQVEFLVFNPMDAGELGTILKAAHDWQHLWPQFAGEFLLVKQEDPADIIVAAETDEDND